LSWRNALAPWRDRIDSLRHMRIPGQHDAKIALSVSHYAWTRSAHLLWERGRYYLVFKDRVTRADLLL